MGGQAIVTLAGEGTRMLPWSRGLRKEFLPLYDRGEGGAPVLKPVAHLVVETLVAGGADRVCVVVQPRDASFVRRYFSVDPEFLARHRRVPDRLVDTRRMYRTLGRVRFDFAPQRRPDGFGDAVLCGGRRTGRHPFFLHAGDGVLIEPRRGSALRALAAVRDRDDLDAVLLVRPVADPRRYGVVEGPRAAPEGPYPRLKVTRMVEKPSRPASRWAATAVYAFAPSILRALADVRRERRPSNLEVTDGIQHLIDRGGRVEALVLPPRAGRWRSVGSPEGYARALGETRRAARRPVRPKARD